MTLSQKYEILVEGSRQKAVISAKLNKIWTCEFTYRFFREGEYPRTIGFNSQNQAHEAGEAWARGDSYAEVSKRWKPVAIRSE